MLSPPVVALSVAALLSFWDLSHWQQVPWIEILYQANKVLVTFSGMCVLGMWLSNVRISRFDLMRSLQLIFIEGCLRFCCVLPLIIIYLFRSRR